MNSQLQLTGIGLRTPHCRELLEKRPPVAWLEVHAENYFGDGGKSLFLIEEVRKHYPVSIHATSLSIGSSDELNWPHLKKLLELSERIDACLISDHLSWSSIDGHFLHDLLPLPYTEESLAHVVSRIQQIQHFLKRQILIENISSYIRYPHSTIPEWEFLKEVAEQSGCGILLDVSNIYVTGNNLGFDPLNYIRSIPSKLVQEIHLAGFTSTTINGREILIDSHSRPVVPAVWDLFRDSIKHLGRKPTIIEWDKDLPSLDRLCLEAFHAEQIMREFYVTTKLTG